MIITVYYYYTPRVVVGVIIRSERRGSESALRYSVLSYSPLLPKVRSTVDVMTADQPSLGSNHFCRLDADLSLASSPALKGRGSSQFRISSQPLTGDS